MPKDLAAISTILTVLLLTGASCNKHPYKDPNSSIGGYVIAKETCHTDELLDYWLIDMTYYPNTPQVGDTLSLNGTTYTNVLKVKGLDSALKKIGMPISIMYQKISSASISTDCNVPIPVVYSLKEIFIIAQGEIR